MARGAAGDGSGPSEDEGPRPSRTGRVVSLRPEQEKHHTDRVGMVVFLGSWAMMFAALFFSYAVLRLRAAEWPPPGAPSLPLVLPAVATAVLLVSSGTLHAAVREAGRDRGRAAGRWFLMTLALAAAFLVAQALTWVSTWQAGLRPSTGAYGGVFYLLSVFHALHVMVGLGVLLRHVTTAARGTLGASSWNALQVVAAFWHFVDFVWIVIFAAVYLA